MKELTFSVIFLAFIDQQWTNFGFFLWVFALWWTEELTVSLLWFQFVIWGAIEFELHRCARSQKNMDFLTQGGHVRGKIDPKNIYILEYLLRSVSFKLLLFKQFARNIRQKKKKKRTHKRYQKINRRPIDLSCVIKK